MTGEDGGIFLAKSN